MSALVKMATLLWNITPSRTLKEKYFATYCWFVRGLKRIAIIDGVKYSLDLSQTIDVAFSLRRFEAEIVSAIKTHTRPGDVIIDIGANTGLHALAFANKSSPNGKVYAFEPTTYAYDRLIKNIELNPKINIEPIKLALSDQNLPSQIINFRSSWRTDGVIDNNENEVSFQRLDDWAIEAKLEKLNIIKLDVDGFEYPILNGSIETLKKFTPLIFMEVGFYHFENPERDPVALLSDIGYLFWDAKTKLACTYVNIKTILASPAMSGITLNIIASNDTNFVP